MMSRKLMGIVIGSSVGGVVFVFIVILLLTPGTFLNGIIKKRVSKTYEGRARVEGVNFTWSKGLELSNFTLLQKEVSHDEFPKGLPKEGDLGTKRKPAFRARTVRIKIAPLSLISSRYILRDLEVSELEAVKGLKVGPGMMKSALEMSASHLAFTGKLGVPTTTPLEGARPIGGGHIRLEKGLLTGELVSILMEALGQPGRGYSFEAISTNFEAKKEGQIYLKDFLAKGAFFDIELEGRMEADNTLDFNTTVVMSKEKMGKQAQKFSKFLEAEDLRIPIKIKGSLSSPKISIKTESLMEELFKGIFQKK